MTVAYFGSDVVSKELFNSQLIEHPPSVIAVDAETVSLRERLPLGFAIATSPSDAWYFKTYPEVDREVELIAPLLSNPRIKKVMHNCIFDLRALPLIGALENMDRTNIADTNVMARLVGRTRTKLFELSPEVGHIVQDAGSLLAEYGGKTMLDIPPDILAGKAADDARAALALYYHFIPDIDPEYFRVEMDVIPILIDISLRGVKVNQEDRAKEEARLKKEVAYYRQLCDEEDFNPASNQQVGYILAKRGNFLPFTKSRKNLQVNEEQLEFLDDPIAALVLNFRNANKLLTTYVLPLKDEDRIYTEYSLDIVVGRIQSFNRNIQNIPPEIRYIFEPDSGVFTCGDASQEHLRILMHFSGDREMQRVYYEGEAGGDIHLRTAKGLNIPRRLAKTVNYAIPYGATPWTVKAAAKIRDLDICTRFVDEWLKIYRDAAEWITHAQDYGMRHNKSLPTLFGRQFSIPEEYTRWGKINYEAMKRKAVNYPVLGSDGEIMKRALIICSKHNIPIALTVHDSIVADGDIEFPISQLETIAPVRIPFEVKKTARWG